MTAYSRGHSDAMALPSGIAISSAESRRYSASVLPERRAVRPSLQQREIAARPPGQGCEAEGQRQAGEGIAQQLAKSSLKNPTTSARMAQLPNR